MADEPRTLPVDDSRAAARSVRGGDQEENGPPRGLDHGEVLDAEVPGAVAASPATGAAWTGQEQTRVRFVVDPDDDLCSAVSADGKRRCWFVGHLIDPVRSDSGSRNLCRVNPAEAMLARYERRARAALEEADGFFVAALHDAPLDAVHLFVDFGGHAALYYARHDNEWLVSSSFRCLREALPGRVHWNTQGVYEFLWGDYCLGNDTLDSRIRQVPAASVLTLSGARVRSSRHGAPTSWDCLPDDDETHERLFAATVEAVRRWSDGFGAAALQLTGGDDSRIVLAALVRLGHRVDCYTHSAAQSVESRLAESAAQLCGQVWHHEHVTDRVIARFARYANQIYRFAGGASELWNIGGMAMRETIFARHDVCFSGLGTSLTMKYAAGVGPRRMTREELARTLAGAWRDPEAPLQLFCEDHCRQLSGSIPRRIFEVLKAFPDDVEAHQLWDLFANAQRVAKWYPNGLRLSGRRIPCHAPLCDRDLALLCLRLPWSIKHRKRFADLILRRCLPKLAYLPTTYRWPERPWPVKLSSRLPRSFSPYAYDRGRLLPVRRRLPLVSKPVAQWVRRALPAHLPALHAFIDREMSLPLDRAAVADTFRRLQRGDLSAFQLLGALLPLLLADGFVFDESTGGG